MKVFNWSFTAKDGQTRKRVSRGPATVEEMRRAAEMILSQQRIEAMRTGAPDPELKLLSVEERGEDKSDFGHFMPAGAKPVDLHEFDNKQQ